MKEKPEHKRTELLFQTLQELYEEYQCLQRLELLELQEDLKDASEILEDLKEDVNAVLEEKATNCIRCGEEFSEVCEEDCDSACLCEYCGHVSWDAANSD
uniref:Uncharacterized protein n=1 Tax=Candidatus Kentrum sp. SD TaxID=2126332 RepID=A0A450Z7D9_9GAMM|nr:MAG: hypothetical protein BECKSD772F_GA0070984_12065 [Candidatus Kentron sp. SD]VFK49652.1 MAG: hypothetical protein BECKSD772E_GA0070983_12095 [Candidatus Kentron sp. SD]VFK81123.1 MAG: hypothetical protein BECKSD772D_GA0070982_12284 [Candidatus Kentron sp. SD]